MYRQYLTQERYDEIVNFPHSSDSVPHCNASTFHEPGICAFCDGYYRRHPDFTPAVYSTPEANGWGGNRAPVVDDLKAAEEEAAWAQMFDEIGEQINDPDGFWRKRARQIKARFTGGNHGDTSSEGPSGSD